MEHVDTFGPGWGGRWDTIPVAPPSYFQPKPPVPAENPPGEDPVARDVARKIDRTRIIMERRLKDAQARRVAAHPDKGGTSEEFIAANDEYEAVRKEYESLHLAAAHARV